MKILKVISVVMFCVVTLMASTVKTGYEVGDRVDDFKLKNTDGRMVSMADYKNAKGFIVIFDCNTCPYSKAYNARIIALNKKYAPQNFPVIAINANDPEQSSGDSFDEMVREAKSKNYEFPYVVDATQEVARKFGATNTPHVFVLAKSGNNLTVSYIGGIDDSARNPSAVSKRYVEDAVDAILAGKPVTTTKTKALGCGIKWKD